MKKQEREQRILARGEHTNHCHVIVGDVSFKGKQIIVGENSDAVLRHLLETEWTEKGEEIWTGEHTDIKLPAGTYEYCPQVVFDPLTKRIENAKD
jgi:hypothetical protein